MVPSGDSFYVPPSLPPSFPSLPSITYIGSMTRWYTILTSMGDEGICRSGRAGRVSPRKLNALGKLLLPLLRPRDRGRALAVAVVVVARDRTRGRRRRVVAARCCRGRGRGDGVIIPCVVGVWCGLQNAALPVEMV